METDEQLLSITSHVPTDEVMQDINDTEKEIMQLQREQAGFTLIGDKLSMFKADARRLRIKEREEFMCKLKRIIELRNNRKEVMTCSRQE